MNDKFIYPKGTGGSDSAPIRETPVQRGMTAALAQELKNRSGELAQAIQDLARVKKGRGAIQAMRDSYDRCYARIEMYAANVASLTGESVEIPAYEPPAEVTQVKTRMVNPPGHDRGQYQERGGKGPSGEGLPTAAPAPGSAQATDEGEWPL